MSPPTLLDQLVEQWQTETNHQLPSSVDDICQDHPELRDELLERVKSLIETGTILPSIEATSIEATSIDATTGKRADTVSNSGSTQSSIPDEIGPYRFDHAIARGGMGAILRVIDDDLDRSLAVKVILPERERDDEMERRFLAEARITGQLQHPGIPPVHMLGHLPDGRPFFSMKLVEGKTFADVLLQPESQCSLNERLEILESICRTIAYAHQCGIIHRDLKPQNVMVGEFGEVQVMDWGLAKQLEPSRSRTSDSRGEQADPSQPVTGETTETESDTMKTRAGVIMGTPAYMAPEQAIGDTAAVDRQSDVYALGSILCEVLVGRPAFRGTSGKQIWQHAMEGDWSQSSAELESSDVPDDLKRLTRSALQKDKQQRLDSAIALANGLQSHRREVEQRLREAELARVEAETKAIEETRRRSVERQRNRLLLSLAATLVVLVGSASAVLVWTQKQSAEKARRLAIQTQDVRRGLEQVTELRKANRLSEARVGLSRTKPALQDLESPELHQVAKDEEKWLGLLGSFDEMKMTLAESTGSFNPSYERGKLSEQYDQMFRENGWFADSLSEAEIAQRIKESEFPDQLLDAVDYWAFSTNDPDLQARLLKTARILDPHPVRDQIRDPKKWQSLGSMSELLRTSDPDDWTSSLITAVVLKQGLAKPSITALHGVESDESDAVVAAELIARIVRRQPEDFWLARLATICHNAIGRDEESVEYQRSAIALRPDRPGLYITLGSLLGGLGKRNEMIGILEKAIERFPDSAGMHVRLGVELREAGRHEDALTRIQVANEMMPDNDVVLKELGDTYYELKRMDEAESTLRKAAEFASAGETTTVDIFSKLGMIEFYEHKDYEKTIEYSRQSLESSGWPRPSPFHGVAPLLLSQSLINLNRFAEAAEVIEFHLKCPVWDSPTMASTHILNVYSLGFCQFQNGEFELATKTVEASKNVQPEIIQQDRIDQANSLLKDIEKYSGEIETAEQVLRGEVDELNPHRLAELAMLSAKPGHRFVMASKLFRRALDVGHYVSLNDRTKWGSMAASTATAAVLGEGHDADQWTPAQHAEWLRLARGWLNDELALMELTRYQELELDSLEVAYEVIIQVIDEPWFRAIRDEQALADWPAEEQSAWEAIWQRNEALRSRVEVILQQTRFEAASQSAN